MGVNAHRAVDIAPQQAYPLEKIIIAVDGYSSCGKSTLAKALAASLQYIFIDSGAMYRAVTHYFLQHQIALDAPDQVETALSNIQIDFKRTENGTFTFLNGQDVEKEIRGMAVSQLVSPVAALSKVRRAMVAQQQRMGQHKGIVMDGRDIGTVVFPQAELKLFVTADIAVRVERRYAELIAKGIETDRASVQKNLQERDHIDSTRADSPLKMASDAVLIDNTNLSKEEQLIMIKALADCRVEN
ncbi:MAG: (d)CMP kinase [Bacteroidota bacterium]